MLANPNGTAPGLWIEARRQVHRAHARPAARDEADAGADRRTSGCARGPAASSCRRRVLKIAGRSESRVEELTQPIYSRWRDETPPIETTILAAPGQIELHLSARGDDEAALSDRTRSRRKRRSARSCRTTCSAPTAARSRKWWAQLLRERHLRIALAESCTGGLATSRLTDVPGRRTTSSAAVVVYSNAAKTELLGVPADLIAAHGAVSEPVAAAMAAGIRERAGVDVGVGITGIAGPTGGTEAKPVGMVCIAVALDDGRGPHVQVPGQPRADQDVRRVHRARHGAAAAARRGRERRLAAEVAPQGADAAVRRGRYLPTSTARGAACRDRSRDAHRGASVATAHAMSAAHHVGARRRGARHAALHRRGSDDVTDARGTAAWRRRWTWRRSTSSGRRSACFRQAGPACAARARLDRAHRAGGDALVALAAPSIDAARADRRRGDDRGRTRRT